MLAFYKEEDRGLATLSSLSKFTQPTSVWAVTQTQASGLTNELHPPFCCFWGLYVQECLSDC